MYYEAYMEQADALSVVRDISRAAQGEVFSKLS
jgi:hypothetical protein